MSMGSWAVADSAVVRASCSGHEGGGREGGGGRKEGGGRGRKREVSKKGRGEKRKRRRRSKGRSGGDKDLLPHGRDAHLALARHSQQPPVLQPAPRPQQRGTLRSTQRRLIRHLAQYQLEQQRIHTLPAALALPARGGNRVASFGHLHDSHVGGPAANVKDEDGLGAGREQAVGQCCGRRLHHEVHLAKARSRGCQARGVSLGLCEAHGNADDDARHVHLAAPHLVVQRVALGQAAHGLARQVRLCALLEVAEDVRRDLLWGEAGGAPVRVLACKLHATCCVARGFWWQRSVGRQLVVADDAEKGLGARDDGVRRLERRAAHDGVVEGLSKGNGRGSQPPLVQVLDDLGAVLARVPDGHARVGRPQVDADDGARGNSARHLDAIRRCRLRRSGNCPGIVHRPVRQRCTSMRWK